MILTLVHEVQAILRLFREVQLWLLTALVLILLVLASQAPINYTINVGYEEGYGSDLPFVADFYPFEPEARDAPLNWRWTSERSVVRLPGAGQRPLFVELGVLSVNTEIQQRGAKELEIWSKGVQIAVLPVNPTGAVYHLMLPAETGFRDDQGFEIRSATINPTGDARSVGVPVDQINVFASAGPNLPNWANTLTWLGAAFVAWGAVRRTGFEARAAFLLLLVPAALLGIAALLDPARAALGAPVAFTALGFGWLVVEVARVIMPPLAARLAVPLNQRALRWLLLLTLSSFALRYGGKMYPLSMWGDIGFHANRYAEVTAGRVLLLSRNRGVDFPYPPAFYLLLAPFSLLGIDRRDLLRFGGAVLDAISPWLVYTIAIADAAWAHRAPSRRRVIWALVAATVYIGTAATFMTTWWNFSTHIFTQFAHLLLITAIVLVVPPLVRPRTSQDTRSYLASRWPLLVVLVALQSLVYLGHFGFWMNMSLLGAMGLLVLGVAAWRGRVAWGGVWALGLSFVLAELIAAAFFYSAYTGMFIDQVIATSRGGLTGMAGRAPAPRDILWRTLWDAGFRIHFGFFPVPLALIGAGLWWWRRRTSAITRSAGGSEQAYVALDVRPWLITGTFLIAIGFAALPFVTQSTLSTRWLMFSAWAIALASVYMVRQLWETGRFARVITVLMAGYIMWVTASVWLGALAWRIRPPEPF